MGKCDGLDADIWKDGELSKWLSDSHNPFLAIPLLEEVKGQDEYDAPRAITI
jgi:hypothetical protein